MDILLFEPGYKNKYPPLGLMKLAYYHKEIRGDFVWFAKGEFSGELSKDVKLKLAKSKYYTQRSGSTKELYNGIEEKLRENCWDRVYITTLFTFEWEKTIEAIEYIKSFVEKEKIFIGGILASLMPNEIEEATGIKPITGLLTSSCSLSFSDDKNIDRLVPDYSILDNIDYTYPDEDAYFTSTTKGCGMKCSFCAVQILEPEYEPFLPIKNQIEQIDEMYGERRNLMLMDNNVLKSKCFDRIIDEIIECGFGAGAEHINPATGKSRRRYVDFNQGLDANLLTPQKAEQLAKIAIRPVRIAFDHIDDRKKYLRAVKLAENAGINEISNYLLYSTPDFSGKGKPRRADTPEDLYDRIRINVDFISECNPERERKGAKKLHLYSFPMQYIPLGTKSRDYIGENWTVKTAQAVKRMLHITKGIVYSEKEIFESVMGTDRSEFSKRLQMPKLFIEKCLAAKAALSSVGTRHKNPDKNRIWIEAYKEWDSLFASLNPAERTEFIRLISDNIYSPERYISIKNKKLRNLYSHYFSSVRLAGLLKKLLSEDLTLFLELFEYLQNNGSVILSANYLYLEGLKKGAEHIENIKDLLWFGANMKMFMSEKAS